MKIITQGKFNNGFVTAILNTKDNTCGCTSTGNQKNGCYRKIDLIRYTNVLEEIIKGEETHIKVEGSCKFGWYRISKQSAKKALEIINNNKAVHPAYED